MPKGHNIEYDLYECDDGVYQVCIIGAVFGEKVGRQQQRSIYLCVGTSAD